MAVLVEILTLVLVFQGRAPAEPGEAYLSDIFGKLPARHHQEWGELGLDTAARPPDGRPPMTLRIGEKEYRKGIGHHANGEIVIELGGKYKTFEAEAGIQWQGGNRGSAILQVLVDGEKRFDSGVMSDSTPPQRVRVPLAGARQLCLVARDNGDGHGCDMVTWADARLICDLSIPDIGPAAVTLCGKPAPPGSSSVCGLSVIAGDAGPQIALMTSPQALVVCVRGGEDVATTIPVSGGSGGLTFVASVTALCGNDSDASLTLGETVACRRVTSGHSVQLEVVGQGPALCLKTSGRSGETAVRWSDIHLRVGGRPLEIPVAPGPAAGGNGPPAILPVLRKPIEQMLIEWDWRMQDGIKTPRVPSSYSEAIQRTLDRGSGLIRDLEAAGVAPGDEEAQWEGLRREWKQWCASQAADERQWEDLWRRVHRLRRRIAFGNPLAQVGPLLFIKQVPACFSHQLTQVYGRYARPGGGIFALDAPGKSMRCRQLTAGVLPEGSCQNLDVSYDGKRVLFSFCQADTVPANTVEGHRGRYYHLYEMAVDGTGLRQLTGGSFDDFAPRYLPDGRILFVSTRRLGWHRCGYPGCENYTLAIADADGSNARPISYHETQEWDPEVLDSGRIVYTRWDYVDRHAIFYEQLWSVRPDGSDPLAFYGNNTFNPIGIWEARQVRGTGWVMATAGAHHAMTAGSIILVDTSRGVDGAGPITRLTPDALFPESETPVAPKGWHAPAGVTAPPPASPEAARWPGHCYRSPYPLSEKYFLAAYSFDALIGEPAANPANMFGVYLADCFGNKELVYRDPNISSLWPTPVRARPRPPVLPAVSEPAAGKEGTYFLQNAHESVPAIPRDAVKRLRIVQVVPKSTPGANRPPVGIPNASPGKQVLGTVPVEADGSACFRAPAGVPLSFQALDEHGQAVQVMRSVTYLQPGEQVSCVGCHESRTTAPPQRTLAQALARPPSRIQPGPDGSNPLSYPILVQPVLDRLCVRCHNNSKPEGGVILTGERKDHYTLSYNALAPRVSYSSWGGKDGDFRQVNSEPVSRPGFFGARGSSLMKLLRDGHEKIVLTPEEMERLVTWMDANALFYGTFDPKDQARQQRGERIAGPQLQ